MTSRLVRPSFTRRSGQRSIVHTQVICEQCVSPNSGAITPAVFVLQGNSVLAAQADTEPGDPMFANVINRMFPSR